MRASLDDLRYALRTLRKSPGFTAVAVLTLALAIGATTAIFTVVNAMLLRELPYKDADRLVLLWGTRERRGALSERSQVCFPDVEDWRKANHSFDDIAAFAGWTAILTGNGEAERITALRVSPAFFPVLGVEPALGRTFAASENLNSKATVAVLSYGLWERRYGRDPQVIGKTLSLNGGLFTIVGVLPREFRGLPSTVVDSPAQIYQPLSAEYGDEIRDGRHLRAIGRLRTGVSPESARAEFSVIARQLERQYPDSNTGMGVRLIKLQDDMVRNLRTGLLVLQAAVLAVVLIACVNIVNLLLARSTVRRKEMAIRAAIGAGRGRIIRQMLTESLLLAALGGMAGLLLAGWGVGLLEAAGMRALAELTGLHMDARVLAFTAGISVLTAFAFGLAPALQLSAGSLADTLRAGGRSAGSAASRRGIRDLLVVAEVSLALVLLVAAGLLIASFGKLRAVHPGFDSRNVLTFSIAVPQAKYPNPMQRAVFFREALSKIRAMAGVRAASGVSVLPESANFNQMGFDIEGRAYSRGETPNVDQYEVLPDYFRVFSIPLIAGRLFSDQDDNGHPNVALIGETTARRLWGNQNAIGVKIRTGGERAPWRTIVGVVGDVYQYGLDSQKTMQLYVPYGQRASTEMTLLVKSESNPTGLTGAIRKAVFAVDKDQAISDVELMDDVLADSMASHRFSAFLLAVFAGEAMLMAAMGIYGVISYSVTQRSSEFGVRMALGAQSRDVVGLVMRQSMGLVLVGVGIGLGAAFGLTRLMAGLLFGVGALDLRTFSVVTGMLIGVAFGACLAPALRATNVDPMVALRND